MGLGSERTQPKANDTVLTDRPIRIAARTTHWVTYGTQLRIAGTIDQNDHTAYTTLLTFKQATIPLHRSGLPRLLLINHGLLLKLGG